MDGDEKQNFVYPRPSPFIPAEKRL